MSLEVWDDTFKMRLFNIVAYFLHWISHLYSVGGYLSKMRNTALEDIHRRMFVIMNNYTSVGRKNENVWVIMVIDMVD